MRPLEQIQPDAETAGVLWNPAHHRRCWPSINKGRPLLPIGRAAPDWIASFGRLWIRLPERRSAAGSGCGKRTRTRARHRSAIEANVMSPRAGIRPRPHREAAPVRSLVSDQVADSRAAAEFAVARSAEIAQQRRRARSDRQRRRAPGARRTNPDDAGRSASG